MALAGGKRLVLASGSPQRRAILEQLGVAFEVIVTGVDELAEGRPEAVAVENARRKARAAAATRSDAPGVPVLGVDTLVALDYGIYGKPADREEAVTTVAALAGRTHRVVSGICLIEADGERTAAAITQVSFRPMSDAAIEWYVETGEWQGRAGGYAIQGRGAALVESIQGDYLNVVGLPVATLLDLLPSLLF
jgi:septum formation protein